MSADTCSSYKETEAQSTQRQPFKWAYNGILKKEIKLMCGDKIPELSGECRIIVDMFKTPHWARTMQTQQQTYNYTCI